jgi:hypothetical protein
MPMLICVLVCAVVGGCVRSIQPVLKDQQLIVDQSVVGTWIPENEKSVIEIQKPGDDKSYKVLYTDQDGKKGTFLVRLGKMDDLLIAEVRPDDPAPGASDVYKAHLVPVYSFMIVTQTVPEIHLRLMKPDWLEKYVQDHPGELQLATLGENGKSGSVVTSSTDDIQSFILRHHNDQNALGNEARLVRAPAAGTQPAK